MPALRPTVLLLALAALAACQGSAGRATAPRAGAPAALADDDLGASLLAGVDNARTALAQHDRLDAANDVNDALGAAQALSGQTSRLFPDQQAPSAARPQGGMAGHGHDHGGRVGHSRDGGHGGSGPGRMTRFEAQVKLVSASAALQTGDLAGADAELKSIRDSVPSALVAPNLPLLEADESLDLALGALAGEQPQSLNAQLANAAQRLRAYRGSAHAGEAKALAGDIDTAVTGPGGSDGLSAARIELWSDRIDGWI